MIGFPKDIRLTRAKETFMFDCRAANLTVRTQRGYREILTTFIKFTGDITVQELKPDHFVYESGAPAARKQDEKEGKDRQLFDHEACAPRTGPAAANRSRRPRTRCVVNSSICFPAKTAS